MLPDPGWVALSLTEHVGGKKLAALLNHFGSVKAVLNASPEALRQVPGIGAKIAASITLINLFSVETAMQRWQAAGVRLITLDDPAYPPILRMLEDAPPTLFVRGNILPRDSKAGALVGTREASPVALDAARRLGIRLAEAGYTVVSGLALGIDSAAHQGALSVPAARTLAVLGSGVLRVYPTRHTALADEIIRRGALLSELAPDSEPSAAALVARNRLISGLSSLLVVVEAGANSGALHAARRAQEQGKTLCALDLPAAGNQALLREGALPVAPDLSTFFL